MKVFQSKNPVARDSNALDAERLEPSGDRAADAPEAGDDRRSALEVAAVLGEGRARPHGALPEEPARPREKEAENRLGDDRPVKRAEMDLDVFWRVAPRDKLAAGGWRREDLKLGGAREPLLLEVPDNSMRRERERLKERALAFDARNATPPRNERPEKLQVPVVRPKALLGPFKPDKICVQKTHGGHYSTICAAAHGHRVRTCAKGE